MWFGFFFGVRLFLFFMGLDSTQSWFSLGIFFWEKTLGLFKKVIQGGP